MQLDRDGAQLHPAALSEAEVDALRSLFSNVHGPGARYNPPRAPLGEGDHAKHGGGAKALTQHLTSATQIARRHLGPAARPVSAKLFDKSASRNWALGWHQDRTIAVRARIDTPGYGPWTV
jgi:hypothetical protein